MVTYKKLGLKMSRYGAGAWYVSGPKIDGFSGTGNKGTVMAEALKYYAEAGIVRFVKGKGWEYVR
jgi:hypothetical protein